tara:strand:+ start:337 stop:456 length:120 start_codon:yes stop_codon:yes gene_type:complete
MKKKSSSKYFFAELEYFLEVEQYLDLPTAPDFLKVDLNR